MQTPQNNGAVPGHVYFVQALDGGPIKIGFAGDPAMRLKELQVGSPLILECVGHIRGTVRTEHEWHRRFAVDRVHGEWFRASRELVQAITQEAQPLRGRRWSSLGVYPRKSKDGRKPRAVPGRYWSLARQAFSLMGDDNTPISASDLAACAGVHRNRAITCLTLLYRNRWLDLSYVPITGTRLYQRCS